MYEKVFGYWVVHHRYSLMSCPGWNKKSHKPNKIKNTKITQLTTQNAYK